MIPDRRAVDDAFANDVHTVLADPIRRAVLRELHDYGGVSSLSELVGTIRETADGGYGFAPHSVRVGLHHHHLPKMADAGFVEYRSVGGRVTLTPRGERAETVRARTAAVIAEG